MTASLTTFGYTERESAFIAVASLQSGYFLRRQFNTFIGRECGAVGQHFIDRSLRLGHVKTMTGWGNRTIYHFCARAVYAHLGDPDNRNRRTHRPDTIRRRLMILDYVIGRPVEVWLLTDKARRDAVARKGIAGPEGPVSLVARRRAGPTTGNPFPSMLLARRYMPLSMPGCAVFRNGNTSSGSDGDSVKSIWRKSCSRVAIPRASSLPRISFAALSREKQRTAPLRSAGYKGIPRAAAV